MKSRSRGDSLDLRRFIGTAAMVAAVAELGIVPSFQAQLRPAPLKVIAKATRAARKGTRI
jgi:hypothetical protein